MGKLKFDKKTENLLPQNIKYPVKHEEEIFDKFIQENGNFHIDYDKKGNAIFTKKRKK